MAIIGKSAHSISGISMLQQAMATQVESGQHLTFSDQLMSLYFRSLAVSQYYDPQPQSPFDMRPKQKLSESVLQGIFTNRIT